MRSTRTLARRRIDEAFPLAMRESTNEGQMLIRFHNQIARGS